MNKILTMGIYCNNICLYLKSTFKICPVSFFWIINYIYSHIGVSAYGLHIDDSTYPNRLFN